MTTKKALRLCNSYERMPFLLSIYRKTVPLTWFKLLGDNWCNSDNIGQHAEALRGILAGNREHWGAMMDGDELRAFDYLPDVLTVYRGCGLLNQIGLSWSLSRDVAVRFPFLARYRAKSPRLLTATIRKSQVVAVKLDREELEIVANVEWRDVLKVESITDPQPAGGGVNARR